MKNTSSRLMQIAIYIIIGFCFIFGIGISRNCTRLNTSKQIGFSKGDTLDIAILYGPGSLYIYSDTISGLNREISRAYSNETKTPVKIWPVSDVADAMNKIESGAFDILASVPLDNSIKQKFLTSESLFLDRLVLVQLKDSTTGKPLIKSSLDLDGEIIYVVEGSAGAKRLKNLADEIGGNIKIIEDSEVSDELLCLKVANKSVRLAVVNEKIAENISKKYPDLTYDNPISFTQFQVWLFNKNDSVGAKKFNDWFDTFYNSEEYRNLLNRF